MNLVKIIIAIVVLGIIAYLVSLWKVESPDIDEVELEATNQYVERLEKEISELKLLPVIDFNPEFYKEIKYLITDYQQKGFLGDTRTANDQKGKLLSQNLYAAYTPLFIVYVDSIFSDSEWNLQTLQFIREKVKVLDESEYLETGSPIDKAFEVIGEVFARYDEISSFIFTVYNFSYTNNHLDSDFPTDDVSQQVQKAVNYHSEIFEQQNSNIPLSNCERLRTGLKEVPKRLFQNHVEYLRALIQTHASNYEDLASQADYSKNIYTPIRSQLLKLNNDIYQFQIEDLYSEYDKLSMELGDKNKSAMDYFRKKLEEEKKLFLPRKR